MPMDKELHQYHSEITRTFANYKMASMLFTEEEDTFVSDFQSVICMLIHEADKWTDEQWLDDQNIFNSINELYDIDYRDYPEDFDRLCGFLDKKWNHDKNGTFLDIFEIQNLSWPLAKKIWPRTTEKTIMKKYLDARKHVTETTASGYQRKVLITQEILDKSWVMKHMGHIEANKAARKLQMEIEMGIRR